MRFLNSVISTRLRLTLHVSFMGLKSVWRVGLGVCALLGFQGLAAQGFQFVAVVSQESARELFASPVGEINLRVLGQADRLIEVERVVLLPYQLDRLPSAALGWLGGGDLAVSNQDAKGEKAAEELFEVRLTLKPDSAADVVLAHGMRGLLRLTLPPRSLYDRIDESLRQLVQKRYRLG